MVARMVGALHGGGTISRTDHALTDYAEGADLRADRRHRRGRDHLTAGKIGRFAQLGLSNLLAARFDLHAVRAFHRGLSRGGESVAAMVAARDRGRARQDANHVWAARRAAPDRVRSAVAEGI